MDISILDKLGFSDKQAKVYLALLRLGPSSVRTLAKEARLNRGTTYDALKWLQDKKVVTFFQKKSKKHFVAENPDKLKQIIKEKQRTIRQVETKLEDLLPELQALHHKGGERPVAKYFERKEIVAILQDVLKTCEHSDEKLYRIYSTEGLREYLYENFPTFSAVRIEKNIQVKVIAIGKGGELRGLDERRWLKATPDTPTYIIIYPGKTAYISLDAKDEPIGVVIENDGVYTTQKLLFDSLWQTLA